MAGRTRGSAESNAELGRAIADFFADKRDELAPNSKEEKIVRSFGVSRSGEFRRIEALPRRDWPKWEDLDELVRDVNEWFALPGCTETLWPAQAVALFEIAELRGLFGPLGVSCGKAWISVLAFSVIECERPLLLVPPDLRAQTELKVLPLLRQHFKVHPGIVVAGHNEISLEKNHDFLDQWRPDMMVIDECHGFADKESGRYKRLKRYRDSAPKVPIILLSGTAAKRSIRDFAHLVEWSLGRGSPLPSSTEHWREVQDWADALDVRVQPGRRIPPGALELFCKPGEPVLEGFQRRLTETPGVVASLGPSNVNASLFIHCTRGPKIPSPVADALDRCRKLWELPDGTPLFEAVDQWRHMRELALGFWYRWEPRPPPEWLRARKAWNSFVNDTLRHNRRQLDTELQVWNECADLASPPVEFSEWRAVRDTYEYTAIAEWIDPFAVNAARRWLDTVGEGIVWTEHQAFGEALQTQGVRYFGAGTKASAEILDARGPIAASSEAHDEGKNLTQWHRNLFPIPLAGGKAWEQVLARTHRVRQEADRVEAEAWLHTPELVDCFARAREDAKWAGSLWGRQKLDYADIVVDV